MPTVLRYKPSVQALAVYETADTANPADPPIDDPLNNLGAIKFHSGLRYPRFIPTKTVEFTQTLDMTGVSRDIKSKRNIYAHGMGDTPVVFAKYISGFRTQAITGTVFPNDPEFMMPADSPWAGTIPLFRFTRNQAVWGYIGADATNVFINFFGVTPFNSANWGSVTVTGRIYVLDTTIVTDSFAGDASLPMLRLEGTRIRVGRGKFDTNFNYMRQGSTVDPVILVRGESMVIKGTPNSDPLTDPNQNWGYRYSVGGRVADSGDGGTSTFAAAITSAGL